MRVDLVTGLQEYRCRLRLAMSKAVRTELVHECIVIRLGAFTMILYDLTIKMLHASAMIYDFHKR